VTSSASTQTSKALTALSGVLVTLCLAWLLAAPADASAGTSTYCNNQTLGSHAWCSGAPRSLYAVYGWGDNHTVCVTTQEVGSFACSTGPGAGAYVNFGFTFWGTPKIENNAVGNNLVHGVAYQP
jgi:hypothetical protein